MTAAFVLVVSILFIHRGFLSLFRDCALLAFLFCPCHMYTSFGSIRQTISDHPPFSFESTHTAAPNQITESAERTWRDTRLLSIYSMIQP